MYDETIFRSSRETKIDPIDFKHPFEKEVLDCFTPPRTKDPISVILTGTAGDGKTHLCRKVWKFLKGDENDWVSDSPYLKVPFRFPENRKVIIHFIRDLSGWAPQQGQAWEPEKAGLLQKFCTSLFDADASDIFLIAGNDGQLIESFRRLEDSPCIIKTRKIFEELLVEGKEQQKGVRLRFFNLSRGSSLELFKKAIDSFLKHPGWQECMNNIGGEDSAFGPRCPIRYNYELLQTELVQSRLASLFDLCDHIGLHIPLRQILLLLTNAVLGHPDVKDRLMVPEDVPILLREDSAPKASLYNNVFGGNLSETRRQGITIFDYFDRFQIGHETSNRIDNILLYGDTDPILKDYYDDLIKSDSFYGADSRFTAAKLEYIEGVDESDISTQEFLQLLISQRRGLFFKIPQDREKELHLWELTVFKFAGEYISDVIYAIKAGTPVKLPILSRLVKGLNRIFTGMLINDDREIVLATSGNYSQAKISRILLERISVRPSKGERVYIVDDRDRRLIMLMVQLSPDINEPLDLTLVRYEFLSRIAEDGALPASFSKECYEDILAFKSRLIAALNRRENINEDRIDIRNELNILSLSDRGDSEDSFVEVIP